MQDVNLGLGQVTRKRASDFFRNSEIDTQAHLIHGKSARSGSPVQTNVLEIHCKPTENRESKMKRHHVVQSDGSKCLSELAHGSAPIGEVRRISENVHILAIQILFDAGRSPRMHHNSQTSHRTTPRTHKNPFARYHTWQLPRRSNLRKRK